MKLLHTSDIHLRSSDPLARPGDPLSRLRDTDEMLNRFCAAAAKHRPDLAIITGDLFDTRSPKPREEAIAVRFLNQLGLFCEWVLLDGNHDGRWVISDPGSATLRFLSEMPWENGTVITDPGITKVGPSGNLTAAIVSVPYPHKRAFDVVRADLPDQERHEALVKALEESIAALHEQAVAESPADLPIIFAGHLTAIGSMVGSERMMRPEDDVSVGSHVLDLFDYGALGHIHRQQKVGIKSFYPGAPEYINFGEVGQQKGWLLVDVEHGKAPVVSVIDSQPRPMLDFEVHDSFVSVPPAPMPDGPIVRIRYHVPDRSGAAQVRTSEAAWYASGASHVQSEMIVPDRAEPKPRAMKQDVAPVEAVTTWCVENGLDPARYVKAFTEATA